MRDYALDLEFATEKTSFTNGRLAHNLTYPKWDQDTPVVVETPNGPLAITHVEMEDGVVKLYTLEG